MRVPLLLSSFCLIFVLMSPFCPVIVPIWSHICPHPVPCPVYLLFSVYFVFNFVPIWSSFCNCWFSFVPILSSFEPQLHEKSSGQILVITRTELFSHFLPGHPAAGQNMDNIWIPSCPRFVQTTYSIQNVHFTVCCS